MSGPNSVAADWHELAWVFQKNGKLTEVEAWFRKALTANRAASDRVYVANTLSNLAHLLWGQPGRLP